ncbi:hypothetical protein ACJMK2_031687 [Sinanodonta woodiana]|uniref:Uncharacterized protein n=1 Tax=Sinanodonta woodiana TaxID=1069815 RepID=A0ABD3WZK9_SINWO
MNFKKSSIQHSLYYYDQLVVENTLLCNVAMHSHLHGRLRCRMDGNKHVIIIKNVTQRDVGLYTVVDTSNSSNNVNNRYYLNVTDKTTKAITGENVTIDWFYSNQAINRTLRIIHPNNGIMMTLPANNTPQIVTAFRNRLIYRGDVARCYISLTLKNIGESDTGFYKIETLYGTSVSGWTHLRVRGKIGAHGLYRYNNAN